MNSPIALPILYSFRRCPYAMRARLALLVSGQRCVLREVVLANKPAALIAASHKGTVPVLVLENGEVLDQSLTIMLWALREHDPQKWLTANEHSLTSSLALIAQCDGGFKADLDRYKYPHRFGLPNGEQHQAKGAVFMNALNQRLKDHTHLTGHRAGLVDVALAPFVRQFAYTDVVWFDRQPWEALKAWLARFEQSTAFAEIMHKYPPWEPGQPDTMFPTNAGDSRRGPDATAVELRGAA